MLIGAVARANAKVAEGESQAEMDRNEAPDSSELAPITGRVKWFDATRGFGFLVCDDVDGDVTRMADLLARFPVALLIRKGGV